MKINKHILDIARAMAMLSVHRSIRIGAVIYNKKHIVGTGFNKPGKTHPLISIRYPFRSIHAELDAIVGSRVEQLEGAVIYVYRVSKTGKTGNAKPCCICRSILHNFGVTDVVYSFRTDPVVRTMRL